MPDLSVDLDGLSSFARRLDRICDALESARDTLRGNDAALQTQLDFALKPEWAVTPPQGGVTHTLPQATHQVSATVPSGTRYYEGPAGPQVSTGETVDGSTSIPGRLEGGGTQVVLPGMRDGRWPVTTPMPVSGG